MEEVATPTPRNGEVRVRIFATAVTASDCIIRSFDVPAKFRILMGLVVGFRRPRKRILGMVLAGQVESVGRDAARFAPGDQVYAFTGTRFGTYAEYTCMSEDKVVAIKPSSATYEEAAAVPYGGLLALHYLRIANIQTGQRVAIYGASGAVGTAAVQLAKHYGAEVTGVCSGANMPLVRSLGADTVIDYTAEDFTQRGDSYDVIFNAVGKRRATLPYQRALTPAGRHITVDDGRVKPRAQDLALLAELVDAGTFKAVIDRRYPR